MLSALASLYPLCVTVGGIVACVRPSTFSWFVEKGPTSYSLSLGFIMLVMALTLELKDLINLFMQRPFSTGCYDTLGLCCSVYYYASLRTDNLQDPGASTGYLSPLNIAWLLPWGYSLQCGTYIPADAIKLSISTLQVVVAPILLGFSMQSFCPGVVKSPFCAIACCFSFIAAFLQCISENIVNLKSYVAAVSLLSALPIIPCAQAILSNELGMVIISVLLLQFAGFLVGYLSAAFGGFGEPHRRAISIEVRMQNSSLGVVMVASHFSSPLIALPPAMSAVIMNIIGSSLGIV